MNMKLLIIIGIVIAVGILLPLFSSSSDPNDQNSNPSTGITHSSELERLNSELEQMSDFHMNELKKCYDYSSRATQFGCEIDVMHSLDISFEKLTQQFGFNPYDTSIRKNLYQIQDKLNDYQDIQYEKYLNGYSGGGNPFAGFPTESDVLADQYLKSFCFLNPDDPSCKDYFEERDTLYTKYQQMTLSEMNKIYDDCIYENKKSDYLCQVNANEMAYAYCSHAYLSYDECTDNLVGAKYSMQFEVCGNESTRFTTCTENALKIIYGK